ncbi:MAG: hypothetical protein ACXACA_00895 [Candidatus Ranarchaeia archaeon]
MSLIDTGSLVSETASFAISASHAENADNALVAVSSSFATQANSASWSDNTISASHAEQSDSSSWADNATSASHSEIADVALNVYISESGQNVTLGTVSGSHGHFDTLTANTLYITETTRSVLYASGSTKFGDTQDDTHQFTGSVSISGSSLSIGGNEVITVADTASMSVASASVADFATSASHALLADSASAVDWENITGRWIQPAPTGSGHVVGGDGDMSYDNVFFYFKSGSRWRRTTAAEF